MSLPLILSDNSSLNLLQTRWKSELDPFLKSPFANGFLLKNLQLITGTNTINHLLGRMMQGWTIVDLNNPISIYRSKPLNELTLTLTTNGPAMIALWVF